MGHSMSGVGVLDKAVVILAACVDGASLAELVERTKLPRATAHRLAQALEIHRMLVRDTQGRWRPGPRLAELANAAPDVLLTAAEGGALPMTAGSAAQVLLAWEPPEAVMPLLPRCKFTGRTLAEVRRRGWGQKGGGRAPGGGRGLAPPPGPPRPG